MFTTLLTIVAVGSAAPIPATEYQKRLQWGFDTDFFKTLDGMSTYNARIMSDLASKTTVKTLRLRSVSSVSGYRMQQLIRGYKTIRSRTASRL